jgi:hypothetical protein
MMERDSGVVPRSIDLTGHFRIKSFEKNWLGKELGHAKEEN